MKMDHCSELPGSKSILIRVVVKIMVPFWVPNIRCCIIIGTQRGTIILTTTHMICSLNSLKAGYTGDHVGEY